MLCPVASYTVVETRTFVEHWALLIDTRRKQLRVALSTPLHIYERQRGHVHPNINPTDILR